MAFWKNDDGQITFFDLDEGGLSTNSRKTETHRYNLSALYPNSLYLEMNSDRDLILISVDEKGEETRIPLATNGKEIHRLISWLIKAYKDLKL